MIPGAAPRPRRSVTHEGLLSRLVSVSPTRTHQQALEGKPPEQPHGPFPILPSHARLFLDEGAEGVNSLPIFWWAVTGSNRRPSRCKRDALPTELTARSSQDLPAL